jgi:predicted GIY-YIG superfamily endonuclease
MSALTRITTVEARNGQGFTPALRSCTLNRTQHSDWRESARTRLKKWSRDKKEALIAGDVAMLKNLSRCTSVPQIRPSQSGKTAI